MKKILLSLLLLISGLVSSQTTMKDYIYISEGYKQDINTGNDVKLGYLMVNKGGTEVPLTENGITVIRSLKSYALITEDTREIKGFLFTFKRNDNDAISYFCVPLSNSDYDVIEKATNFFFKSFAESKYPNYATAYLWASLNMVSNQILLNSKQE